MRCGKRGDFILLQGEEQEQTSVSTELGWEWYEMW